MKRVAFITVIMLLFFMWMMFSPIVVDMSSGEVGLERTHSGEKYNPFEKIEINDGIRVYVQISRDDYTVIYNKKIIMSRIIYTDDMRLLSQLKECSDFLVSGGDMATCTSKIYITKNNKTIFKSSIGFEKNNLGLQSQSVGWSQAIYPDKIKHILLQFDVVTSPLVILF